MNGIGFKNMKVFKEQQWFDFKNITLLTGTNNSGKSSIINAMQMLQENIKATNIDDLIKTEFKLSSNLSKYGSIANFVNNEAIEEDNYFLFTRQIGNVEYSIKIDINQGLESYGNVNAIKAIDFKTKEEIFKLRVKKPHPKYKCSFNINYKYFIDRFNKKCENTEKLRTRIVQLDKFQKEVNKGNKTLDQFKNYAKELSKELSVYISVYDIYEDKSYNCGYVIHNENSLFYDDDKKIDELGVFFHLAESEDDYIFQTNVSEFITLEKYNKLFQSSYSNGIFNFSFLWENKPDIKNEFENIICSYYNKNFKESHQLLSNDLITLISNSNWDMEVDYDNDYDPELVPQNLTKKYIDSLTDFGLIGSMIKSEHNHKAGGTRNHVSDNYILAKQTYNKNSDSLTKLLKNNFPEEIFSKISKLIIEYHNANFVLDHSRLISKSVFNEIYEDINQKIFKIDLRPKNVYVSSNRFTTKRFYNFNDNTDFTNLLRQVEEPTDWHVNHCKEFISKWIIEFGIADELLLKPDIETGNFKASLRIGNKETQLADFGLGTNQLLPIIFSLGIHRYLPKSEVFGDVMIPRTVVIEEPEANLHPALQSKLADMFADANAKFGVQIIVETHSEYLIRRMQYLVAKDSLKVNNYDISISNEKVNIYYINSELDELGRKAYEINFKNNGQLTESFGKGFIDETTNLQFELYKLNNAQSN